MIHMKNTLFIFLLLVIFKFTIAQKILISFNNCGFPEEISLVDSNGIKIGYSNFYNNQGILIMSLMYKNGVPNGQWSRFDDKTGKIKETFYYVNGKLKGEHNWFNDFGIVIKKKYYNHEN